MNWNNREERNAYNREWRKNNKDKTDAYTEKNRERINANQRNWRKNNREKWLKQRKEWADRKKDGYHTLYYLPEEHYIGITNFLEKRLHNHSCEGRITEGCEVIARFERSVDAHWVETMFHQRGYNGYHMEKKAK